MKALRIIIDNRERNLEILEALSGSGIGIDFAQLPVGDYIVSDRMCVERKTVGDFESSIIDNRLFDQMGRLNASFGKPVLIIEGDEAGHRLGGNVIMGAILKLYTECNVQMLRSSGPAETAEMLSKFAQREQDADRKEPRIMGIKKAYSTRQWQLLILGSVPGIGPNLAGRLLSHFGTIRNIVNAGIESLTEVDKIGKKKAGRIYGILNAEFEVEGK